MAVRRLTQFYRDIRIKYKFVIVMYLFLAPLMIAVNGYFIVSDYQESVRSMSAIYRNLVEVASDNISYLNMDVLDLTDFIGVNADVRRLLTAGEAAFAENPLMWEQNALMRFVRDMLSVKSQIRTLILYPENGVRPFYVSSDKSVHNTDIAQVRETAAYREAALAMGDSVWTFEPAKDGEFFLSSREDKIVISRIIFDLSKRTRLGYIAFSMDVDEYRKICESVLLHDNEGVLVLNARQQVLAATGAIDEGVIGFLNSGAFEARQAAAADEPLVFGDFFLFCQASSPQGIAICYMAPRANWADTTKNILLMGLAIMAAMLLCLLPLSMLVSSIITKPLQTLRLSMQRFQEGDFDQQIQVGGMDEIGEVSLGFNRMVQDIRALIEKNYLMVLHERQSELSALQAQINPHFLYNTLDSLYWQALNAESYTLAEDIYALSQLFRLVLSRGQDEITLSKEIELLQYYLHIQKMRFDKKLEYAIDIDERMLGARIPKLILQPFVENAMVHGLADTGRVGRIDITGRMDGGRLCFTIRDNGVGMPKEQIERLLRGEEDAAYASQRVGRYAISNVRQRLSLKYGDRSTFDIQSVVGEGTTVIITIPTGA